MKQNMVGSILKSTVILVLFFALLPLAPACGAQASNKGYHHLVLLTDLHLPGEAIAAKEQAIDTINSWQDADMVVALGDLCQERGTNEEYDAVKVFFSRLKKPLFPIVGNHDYIYADNLDYKGKKYRATTETRNRKLMRFKETFGLKELSYSMNVGSYTLIFVSLDAPEHLTEISPKQMEWLRLELEKIRKTPTIIFFHAPLEGTLRTYNNHVNRPDYVAQPAGRIRDLLLSNPQVFLWVSGHTHTSTNEESFASAINVYEKRVTTIHNADMNRSTIWTNSLFLYPDRVVVKTYNHKKGAWVPSLERLVMAPAL